MEIVLINPGDRKQVYQDLGKDYSAVEPPYWMAAIAAYLRNNGIAVALIDANAENISPEETAALVKDFAPTLTVVLVYGSQPSASTQNMTIAGKICRQIKDKCSSRLALAGLHPSALPERTLREESVDYVIEGEGPGTMLALIKALKQKTADLSSVPGLWYHEKNAIRSNPRAPLIKDLDAIFPLAAWDLLPMGKYKAHNWHCFHDIDKRMPYGAIYTSLGCPFSCEFCCINVPFGKPGIRFRSPELVVKEIGCLVEKYGVKNLKIIDELFVLNESHYMRIVDLLLARGYDLNIWAYARVDTVKPENLKKMKQVGINWLALGIESANPAVRDGALKQMRSNDIEGVVRMIQAAGIYVMGNYIFGLPDDTMATMQETLDLAQKLNCEFVNMYCAMAYPGSKLYDVALKEGWALPQNWHGFSQHSYEMLPLPTKHLTAKQVLQFRDDAFHEYFAGSDYLEMVERKFGKKIRDYIVTMTKIRLRRKILED